MHVGEPKLPAPPPQPLRKRQAIEDDLKRRHEAELARLGGLAEQRGLALLSTPLGLVLAAMRGGEVLPPEEFAKLPEEERQRLPGS